MEIPEEMIETLVPAVREQLESPDTAYVKNCLERLTGREKLGEQEALELMAQALAGHGFQYALNSLFTLADISFYISAPAVVNAVSVKYTIEQVIIHSINRQSR